jgi:phosphoglycolate phosphatase-like HAD superfamily hydrolase
MLVLFDIDATLITTEGKGIEAMRRAGRDTFGEPFEVEHVDTAGRLDPLIMADMLAAAGHEATEAAINAFRDAYRRRLDEALEPGVGRPLPGVVELLDRLRIVEGLVMGLVTGNLPETGALKLERAGIDVAQFTVHAWATDSPHTPPHRDHLPGVALERYAAATAREAERGLTWIVGDTPHDVRCARAHGLRCLAVATGRFGESDLASAGADRVVSDLRATEEIVRWLTSPA